MQAKHFIEEASNLLIQISGYQEQLKEMKKSAKEQGLQVELLMQIARSIANQSLSELEQKTNALSEAIDEYVNNKVID